ncbi:MAG: PAS domain S-box protein [Chitinophagaceae bacterium]|nr:MAG: PAS domain S-box protein [Chitinophagaceae bacterium]
MKADPLADPQHIPGFLRGGGELGKLIREFPWENTSLGRPDEWPQSLRTSVGIMLNSHFGKFIFWGPDYTVLYNDAYREFLGDDGKHPHILGKPFREGYAEIWTTLKPLLDGICAGGPSFFIQDQLLPIFRNGKVEEVYWTYSLDPIYDEEGKIGGIFATASDTSEKAVFYQQLKDAKTEVHEEKYQRGLVEKSEAYFRELTDTVPTIIWITDKDGYCNYLNRNWYELTGQTPEEAEGFGWLTATHPDDQERAGQDFVTSNNQQIAFKSMYRLRVKDGSYRWVMDSGSPKYAINGEYEGMIGTVVDIHEQKIAQDEEKRYAHEMELLVQRLGLAMEAGELGLFEVDMATGEIYPSSRFIEIFGGLIAVRNSDYASMIHPDDLARREAAHKQSLETGALDYVARVLLKNGLVKWVRFKGLLSFDEAKKPLRLRGIAQDITDQKVLETQKDNFIGIASHELKTPVTSIKAYAQLMENEFRKNGEIMYADMMVRIDKQVNRLNFLISDLLDVTKVNSGKLAFNYTVFDLDLLVDEVGEDLQRISPKHTIIRKPGFYESIKADRDRLNQVITNLVSNAIKYSPGESQVRIESVREGDMAKICVTDYGIGVSAEMRERVFEQFYRVGAGEHKYPGLGLGLYISSEIITRMGGRIWVEPGVEKGSVFCFTIPIGIDNPGQERAEEN